MDDLPSDKYSSAFPLPELFSSPGLSKREHFAALILAGLHANEALAEEDSWGLVRISVQQADRLLEVLAAQQQAE